MVRTHKFKIGQLYQNVGWKRRFYNIKNNGQERELASLEWLKVGDCFIVLEIVDGRPLSLEDFDFYLKILHKEKISWIGFSCAFDSKAFSSEYRNLE